MQVTDNNRYIGMISGTSADGIDAIAVDFTDGYHIAAFQTFPYPNDISEQLQPLLDAEQDIQLADLGLLDARLGDVFAEAALNIIREAGWEPSDVAAIGSHGQTLIHGPDTDPPFSIQIGDPNRIAFQTGLPVVADFRRSDLAAGGQAAPLAPLIHNELFRMPNADLAVVNIGGIGNVTWLSKNTEAPILGFDSGPGNCLMNAWCRRHLGQDFDDGGRWAAGGQAQEDLLRQCLNDKYLNRPPPKSTGREVFTLEWMERQCPRLGDYAAQDVQATLLQLTAISIRDAIQHCGRPNRVLVCGGGAHNDTLMQALSDAIPDADVHSTEKYGISPDAVEALLFAWLTRQRMHHQLIDTRHITGARQPLLLGNIFQIK